MLYIKLFYEFFKIGLFTIGGGLVTIPLLKDLAERTNWYDVSFITEMLAVSESTPGPIGLNMATYVGYEVAGVLGGIISTVAEIIPSIIIVSLVSVFFINFRENKNIQYALQSIRATVTALIAVVGVEMFRISVIGGQSVAIDDMMRSINFVKLLLFMAVLYLSRKYNKHPIFYICISGLIGVIFSLN